MHVRLSPRRKMERFKIRAATPHRPSRATVHWEFSIPCLHPLGNPTTDLLHRGGTSLRQGIHLQWHFHGELPYFQSPHCRALKQLLPLCLQLPATPAGVVGELVYGSLMGLAYALSTPTTKHHPRPWLGIIREEGTRPKRGTGLEYVVLPLSWLPGPNFGGSLLEGEGRRDPLEENLTGLSPLNGSFLHASCSIFPSNGGRV